MKKSLFSFALALLSTAAFAQKWGTKTGQIDFFSKTPMEDISAKNKKVQAVVDAASGAIAVSVNIRDFKFERSLMEEHFNENYLESDKYPTADFRGTIENPKSVDWTKDGVYQVKAVGDLKMHGVTQKVAAPMQILVKDGKAGVTGTFPIQLSDYNIKIPTLVVAKIAKQVDVTVLIAMQKL